MYGLLRDWTRMKLDQELTNVPTNQSVIVIISKCLTNLMLTYQVLVRSKNRWYLIFYLIWNVFYQCSKLLISERFLLFQLAMTHPSYRTNYGTNPDHARNSLTNCGFRQLEYGDRQIHYIHRRKRGKGQKGRKKNWNLLV